jgi:hypothetical protein
MTCQDKDLLVAYLFEESTPDERRQVEAHLAGCEECRREIDELGHVRAGLRAWSPAETRLGFRVVRDNLVPVRPRLHRSLASWGLAAAAVLVLAAGAGLANLEIRYGADGITIRTGRAGAPEIAVDSGASPARSAATSDDRRDRDSSGAATVGTGWRTDMEALERQLRAEFTSALEMREGSDAGRGASPGLRSDPRAAGGGPNEAEVLQRVRALIEESEQRQQRELARRLAQVINEVDAQRRADLLRIEQGLGQLEGLTGAEVARQREMLNYLMRVSQR